MSHRTLWLAGAILLSASPAKADIVATVISERGLPYELSPSNYSNSPSNYDNSASNYDNSVSNYDNSPSNYDNSPSEYENGANGRRRVLTANGDILGYYVFSKKGVLNFYSGSKRERVFYIPSGGQTQSVFMSEGSAWCGSVGTVDGKTVLGLTRNCMLQMMMD